MNEIRRKILDYIHATHVTEGRYPTIIEIAHGLALSRQRTLDNLNMLAHLGYLRIEHKQIVAMRLPGQPALKAEV
jgi:Mn-dependent DtxR family transcriptional regulator